LSLPANKLELWMAVEASRWTQPVFRELYSEKEVIKVRELPTTQLAPTLSASQRCHV
jgi:hypothetical protein